MSGASWFPGGMGPRRGGLFAGLRPAAEALLYEKLCPGQETRHKTGGRKKGQFSEAFRALERAVALPEQDAGSVAQNQPCCLTQETGLTKGQGRVTRKLTRRPRGAGVTPKCSAPDSVRAP